LFLHGFPEAWWAFRHQLPAVAAAGFTAAAMDLRGYGDSDKPPEGYDALTLAADVAGVIGSLGHRSARLVGHGWGGYVAWTLAATHTDRVTGLCTVGAPHPREMLRMPIPVHRQPFAHVLAMQPPWIPERRIRRRSYLAKHLQAWSSPHSDFPTEDDVDRCQRALAAWPSPHCVLEYHRWLCRSLLRRDGRNFQAALRRPVTVPVLQLNGADDPVFRHRAAALSARHVRGRAQRVEIKAAGHFPHEEQPAAFNAALLPWLSSGARSGVDGPG
jgi:pimeloyl-ACP methyl ester carboxylesterase